MGIFTLLSQSTAPVSLTQLAVLKTADSFFVGKRISLKAKYFQNEKKGLERR